MTKKHIVAMYLRNIEYKNSNSIVHKWKSLLHLQSKTFVSYIFRVKREYFFDCTTKIFCHIESIGLK